MIRIRKNAGHFRGPGDASEKLLGPLVKKARTSGPGLTDARW